jgi:hypothetical protein
MKMRKNRKKFFLAGMLFMLALSACGTRKPTLTGDMVITSVAQTVQADLTKVAASIPTSTSTPVVSPTSTSEPFTPTPTATFTPTGPTPTNTSASSVDYGVWVSSNPPDGTVFVPNQTFTMEVTLMNTGETTWTTTYYIKFSSGERMNAPEKIFMPYSVPPGKNAVIAITFKAPDSLGTKRSTWAMVNAANKEFSIFWCEIEVASAPVPTATPTTIPTP